MGLVDGWLVKALALNLKVEFDLSISRKQEVENAVAQNIMHQTKVSVNRISLYFYQVGQGNGSSAKLIHLTNFQLTALQHHLLQFRINQF